jgi:hypothetical protein
MSEQERAFGAAQWLSLAAAPTFGMMALLSFIGGDAPAMICSAGQASPLNGMTTMYVLMSAFHWAPWFKLISNGRSAARQS